MSDTRIKKRIAIVEPYLKDKRQTEIYPKRLFFSKKPHLHSRKQQILLVAAKLFRQRGYKGTKMDDIAEALHIKGASLYNHIKSKDEILNALLMQNAQAFDQRMQDIRQADVDPLQQLELVISLHIELTLQNPDAMALMLHDWVHLSEDHKRHYIDMRDRYEQHFKAILQASIDRGQIVGMDLNLMMFLILSQLRSLYAWCTKYKDFNRIELENSVKTSILKGFLKK